MSTPLSVETPIVGNIFGRAIAIAGKQNILSTTLARSFQVSRADRDTMEPSGVVSKIVNLPLPSHPSSPQTPAAIPLLH